ncbi:DUF4439 domain-containing protein [Streptacidiphilus sp. PB12-B1b]|nr:DUF4439 domain-containing protein [Streptacidiphilus sp. PB12-B1b]
MLGLLTACGAPSDGGPRSGRRARTTAETDPDTAVRARELRSTEALAARYDAALASAGPALAATLRPLRAQLAAQLTAFGSPAPAAPTPSATPTPRHTPTATPTASATPATTGSAAPAPDAAALAAAERATAEARGADLAAASPALARLIASAAACGAQHAVLLGGSAPAAEPLPARGPLTAAALAALQAALAAENAAVYGYGVIGAQLAGDDRARAAAAMAAHQARGAALQQRISSAPATPAAAAPGYELPFPVGGRAAALRLAALLEDRLAVVYANGVQATTAGLRTALASALRRAALDALAWSGTASAFPGLPERGAPH